MGAWIEIIYFNLKPSEKSRRTPRWVRGLKFVRVALYSLKKEVAPHDGCVD